MTTTDSANTQDREIVLIPLNGKPGTVKGHPSGAKKKGVGETKLMADGRNSDTWEEKVVIELIQTIDGNSSQGNISSIRHRLPTPEPPETSPKKALNH